MAGVAPTGSDDESSSNLMDPRPRVAEAPYTFFLPVPEDIARLTLGNLVKLIFRCPPDAPCEAERMWVRISERQGSLFRGQLDNVPEYITDLKLGDDVAFGSWHIIDTDSVSDSAHDGAKPVRRIYWERCLVDDVVVAGRARVGFLYREEPKNAEGDKFPDSGWRIRADTTGLGKAEADAMKALYVALGAVLNADDSWFHLIDSPVGSKFARDAATGKFETVTGS